MRFNPRPRTGGDKDARSIRGSPVVSIRAPARGATAARIHGWDVFPVSIRAPARGATTECGLCYQDDLFQSAPPHGGRPLATAVGTASNAFQSAPPHGGRRSGTSRVSVMSLFQSAPPHGGRPRRGRSPRNVESFNPRPRTGGDTRIKAINAWFRVSIRAPARSSPCPCFNPRPRTGGDLSGWPPPRPRKVSIRAPARGATQLPRVGVIEAVFQSAPPHGGRPAGMRIPLSGSLFQSAPPHGGRLEYRLSPSSA